MVNEKRSYELRARAEAQRRTRERIVQATMQLHEEVGPARTTVAEIARRADVQRLTVYNHFPEDVDLLRACQAGWMGLHPPPDPSPALSLSDPTERTRAALRGFYSWYREGASMLEKIQRDRGTVHALDALMEQTADAQLSALSDALAAGFRSRGRRSQRRRALIRLALEFWTWRCLAGDGLADAAAADLMTEVIVAVAAPAPGGRSG